jgi:hypothetical protein
VKALTGLLVEKRDTFDGFGVGRVVGDENFL